MSVFPGSATYGASTSGAVSTGTAANTNTSVLYLWHPNTSHSGVKVRRIVLSWGGGSGGTFSIRIARITGENATPGGTLINVNPYDSSDAATACTVRKGATGAPTRVTDDVACYVQPGAGSGTLILPFTDELFTGCKSLSCSPAVGEGWEIRTVVESAMTTAAQVGAEIVYSEDL
jgi:hypothetical protein